MKTKLVAIVLMVLISSIVYGQDFTTQTVQLWDTQHIPFNKKNIILTETVDSTGRRISQISVPELYIYRKSNTTVNGATLLYIPGGGYAVVSLKNRGESLAKHFLKKGFDVVAVLKYRLPDERIVNQQYKVPLCDAQKALSLLHENSDKWFINKNKIAVMGGSAGGHLAASLANLTDEIIAPGVKPEEVKQAISILLYPVISFNLPYRHKGSYKRLLGEKSEDKSLLNYYSMEQQVSKTTPPTYIIYAVDDASVPYQNSEIYLDKLDDYNIAHGSLKLEKGGHGFGLNFAKTGVDWTTNLMEWLNGNTDLFNERKL